MVRLFVAIDLPINMVERLTSMASGLPGARWTRPENFHLSLRFIGEVDEGAAEDIDSALAEINALPFNLSISGVGYFGKTKAARAVWAGVERNDDLIHLQHKIESALQRTGINAEERKFTPHITLARLKGTPRGRLEDFVASQTNFRPPPFHINKFVLYSSFLASSGAIYTPEADYPLSAR